MTKKVIIVDKCSMKDEESECVHKNIIKQKEAKNDAEYEEYSVTYEVPSYFNIFECGRNILNILDDMYERACMANPKDKYYTKLLETVVDYNDHHSAPLSNKKLRQAVSKVMEETEELEHDAKLNANNVTIDHFSQPPSTTNTQGKIAKVPNERQITSDILAETINGFKGLTLQSRINDSKYYHSEEDDIESDPNNN